MELQVISRNGDVEARTFPDGAEAIDRDKLLKQVVEKLGTLRPEELKEIDDYIDYLNDPDGEPDA